MNRIFSLCHVGKELLNDTSKMKNKIIILSALVFSTASFAGMLDGLKADLKAEVSAAKDDAKAEVQDMKDQAKAKVQSSKDEAKGKAKDSIADAKSKAVDKATEMKPASLK